MQRLDPGGYARVRPLVPGRQEAGHMAFVHAVLDGRQPGAVYVDEPARPRSALVCNDNDFWFAIGEARGDLVAAALPALLRELPSDATALWCTTPAWEAALQPLFAEVSRRKEFHYRPGAAREVTAPLPPGVRLEPLRAALAVRFAESGLDPWVVRTWGGPEALAAGSFGSVAVFAGAPVAFCVACAIGGPEGDVEAEVEVGTAPEWRGRGLATAVAREFIARCRERGLVPAWSCAAENEPSWRLAARLGFVEFREIAGFELREGMRLEGGRWRLPPG